MMTYPDIELPETLYELEATNYPNGTDEAADLHLLGVLAQISDERHRQDQEWGGPEHDDHHSPEDWEALLALEADKLSMWDGRYAADYRDRLIKVAALAVAAAQAWDRCHATAPATVGGEG
jgi:hypothetical protein